jgi:hypothetical protein
MRKWEATYGTAPRLQLNDQIATPDDISRFIANEKDSKAEAERPLLIASLRVDKEITMGLVSDVKTELRKAGQLKINYSATARSGALK